MKKITRQDLRDAVTLLFPHQEEDGEGGWRTTWRKGPRLWAFISPLSSTHGFHKEVNGHPLLSQEGYLKATPPARYKLILRAGINLPQKVDFLWHLYSGPKRLTIISAPTLIQAHCFIQILTMESPHEPLPE